MALVVMVISTFFSVFLLYLQKLITDALVQMEAYRAGEEVWEISSWFERFALWLITAGRGGGYLMEHLWLLPLCSGVGGALEVLILVGFYLLRNLASTRINKTMELTVFTHMDRLPYSYFKSHKAGDILQVAGTDLNTLRRFMIRDIPNLENTTLLIVFCLLVLVSLDWRYALIVSIPIAAMFVYAAFLVRPVRAAYRASDEEEAKMVSRISDSLQAVRVVKAYVGERKVMASFEKTVVSYRKAYMKWNRLSAAFNASTDVFVFGTSALALGLGIALVHNGQIGVGTLVISCLYVNRVIWPVRGAASVLANFGQAMAASDRVSAILEEKEEDTSTGLTPPLTGDIVFSHVSFSYPDGNGEKALDDVSFSIKAGTSAAIMGKTGAGKSTIALLLSRLYDYDSGSITIGGYELKDIQRKYLRKHIGLVLQDPYLFSKTIKENLALAAPKATDEEIASAARIADLDRAIASFPLGYETPVGEKGVTLSGGQRQRVAIAQALVEKAPILVLDDSLSAVDAETDLAIRQRMRESGEKRTSLIVTHRVNSARGADKILVFDQGRLIQEGPHEKLSKEAGLYREIFAIQSEME